jgi:hypothetical protein
LDVEYDQCKEGLEGGVGREDSVRVTDGDVVGDVGAVMDGVDVSEGGKLEEIEADCDAVSAGEGEMVVARVAPAERVAVQLESLERVGVAGNDGDADTVPVVLLDWVIVADAFAVGLLVWLSEFVVVVLSLGEHVPLLDVDDKPLIDIDFVVVAVLVGLLLLLAEPLAVCVSVAKGVPDSAFEGLAVGVRLLDTDAPDVCVSLPVLDGVIVPSLLSDAVLLRLALELPDSDKLGVNDADCVLLLDVDIELLADSVGEAERELNEDASTVTEALGLPD